VTAAVLPDPDQAAWKQALAAGGAERYLEATAQVQELLARHPGHDGLLQTAMRIAHNAFDSEGAFAGALALARAARSPQARHSAWEQLLFWAPFVPDLSAAEIGELSAQWSRHLSTTMPGAPLPLPPPRKLGGPLRVGYLCPAFGFGADYLPLAHHDPALVTAIGYSSAAGPMRDPAAQPGLPLLRDLAGLSDGQAAALIRQDDIDLLVDLGGTGDAQRNGILAYRPARVQAGWSNKLVPQFRPLLDWVLGEPMLFEGRDFDLAGAAGRVHLPQALAVVGDRSAPPARVPPPVLQTGRITFGSTASVYKINGPTLQLWSRVLQRIPGARFVYSAPRLPDLMLRKLREGFAAHGIAGDRVTLQTRPPEDFAAALNGVDLALDAIPFSSNFSCLQALRQGVPVLSCRGTRLPGRFASSLLVTIGHGELVAEKPEDLVERAAELAADPARLRDYRDALPAAVKRARLEDYRFTAACLESAYAAIWEAWKARA